MTLEARKWKYSYTMLIVIEKLMKSTIEFNGESNNLWHNCIMKYKVYNSKRERTYYKDCTAILQHCLRNSVT